MTIDRSIADMAAFLEALRNDGRVFVGEQLPEWNDRARDILAAWERTVRADCPRDPPQIDDDAAEWGAVVLYRICQFLVFRDAPAERVRAELSRPGPDPGEPQASYSVDLTFRFLPSLWSLAKAAAPGDALVAALQELGARWPLSSVGLAGIEPPDVEPVVRHASLLQMYADRIIERNDTSRLSHPKVCEAVQAALGAHPELAPKLAEGLLAGTRQAARAD